MTQQLGIQEWMVSAVPVGKTDTCAHWSTQYSKYDDCTFSDSLFQFISMA